MDASFKLEKDENILRLEGLPRSCSIKDIDTFFEGLDIANIHLLLNESGQSLDNAFVIFAESSDLELALMRNKAMIKHRYILLFRSSTHQMINYKLNARNCLTLNESDTRNNIYQYLQVKGLPWTADKAYIAGLFPG